MNEFLEDEIKGPAKFSCKSGSGCQFEEPAMNELINDIFADRAIFLDCNGGECLHYSQVPGYVVCNFENLGLFISFVFVCVQAPPKPDNTKWLAFSAAGALAIFLLVIGGNLYSDLTLKAK